MPITLNRERYTQVHAVGTTLYCLHTYEHDPQPPGTRVAHVAHGEARYNVAISTDADKYPEEYEYLPASRTLRIGDGEFGPISPEVMAYEVSGLRVVESWLDCRMKGGTGGKSGPLDDLHPESWPHEYCEELLHLLWIIEQAVSLHATLADLLEKIRARPLLSAADLPGVHDAPRKPPRVTQQAGLFDPAVYTIKDEPDDGEDADDED